jgi:hypothetical protein
MITAQPKPDNGDKEPRYHPVIALSASESDADNMPANMDPETKRMLQTVVKIKKGKMDRHLHC